MQQLSVLIADDHQLVRDTIAHYLASEPGVDVALAVSLPEALSGIAERGGFDIVLLDVLMPGMDGLSGVDRAIAANPDGAVVLMSGAARRGYINEAIARGARGFIPKTLPARGLIHALRLIAAGRVYLPVALMAEETADLPEPLRHLTPQEGRVLRRLCEGMTNKEIARELHLGEVTIKTHMRALCSKLGARNRTHAAMIATPFLAN